jgi:hypothetical protein
VNDLISPALTARIKALGRPSTAVRQADAFIAGVDAPSVKAMADKLIVGLDPRKPSEVIRHAPK